MRQFILTAAVFAVSAFATWHSAPAEIPPIKRVLPPEGLEIPADVRERLESRLAATKKRMEAHKDHSLLPDVEIFTKAVELALIHREFYVPKDFAKADWALDEANKRVDSLDKDETPWTRATGLVVRGYRSTIDGSAQPYGLVIPKDHDFEKPCPLYVWLHGRGDKNTDLHFLQERATKPGQIAPPGAIVVHPFGRHCVGYKSAGEVDVFECIRSVKTEIPTEMNRLVLIGFSMGGAGAWHIGAHHARFWAAVSPGAGFAETAQYQRLTPDRYPPWYEQKLWGQYDVPNYVRNLFNTRVFAYSGELDKQIQAARIMEAAFRGEGRELTHFVGPGVEHKYEPKTLDLLMEHLHGAAAAGRPIPSKVHLQTRTLRYSAVHWIEALQLEEHWLDSRIDAELIGNPTDNPLKINIETKNIAALRINLATKVGSALVTLDGTESEVSLKHGPVFKKDRDAWHYCEQAELDPNKLIKRPEQTGPIDDAFMHRFLVIEPTGKSLNSTFQAWCDFELANFKSRWRALMRAEPRTKPDREISASDLDGSQSLILWGDPDSNSVMARLLKHTPLTFDKGVWTLGKGTLNGNRFVPALVFPLDLTDSEYLPGHYVVFNSGLTFREGHDRTNSQQNPKLPDWAIIDITQPPDAFSPGRIHDAGFFDEAWKLKGPVKGL